jgi:hypothetical protein
MAWTKAAGISEGPLFRRMAKGGKVLPDALSPVGGELVIRHPQVPRMDLSARFEEFHT